MTDNHVMATIQTYNETASEFIRKVQKYAPVPEREKFIHLVKSGGKILDAGCGSGRDANYFAGKGFSVTGIDLSDTLLEYAKKNAKESATFLTMDLREITFPNESFDGIWACASLIHLKRKEILPVLRKFHDLLIPQGILFLLMKEGTDEKFSVSGSIKDSARYFSYYSTEEIRTMLMNAGFSILAMYTWDQKDRNIERPHEIWITTFADI